MKLQEPIETINMLTGEVTESYLNETIEVGDKFWIIGLTTVFVAVEVFTSYGELLVRGVSTKGRKVATVARVCDTVLVSHTDEG
jgi:hypothetical protein